MNYTSFTFRIKLSCPDCNNAIPVNRIKDSVECPNCSTKVNLHAEWWRVNILSNQNFKVAKRCLEGEARSLDVSGSDIEYDLAYGQQFPRCRKCNDELSEDEYWTLDEIKQAADSAEYIQCKRCNEQISIRKADDLIYSIVDHPVIALIGEDSDKKIEKNYTGKAMMFACMSCGAGLKADGNNRVVECQYCNTDNFLPEELWRRMHPIPKPEIFYMLAEYKKY